jgi:AcrR family transcriptional regulator
MTFERNILRLKIIQTSLHNFKTMFELNSVQYFWFFNMKKKNAQKLLEAAEIELITNNGLLEISGVAARAEVSVGLAYHHFGSKTGLISAVVDNFYTPLRKIAFGEAIAPDLPWLEREKKRTSALIEYYYSHPLAKLITGRLARESEVLDIEQSHMNAMLVEGARNVAQGQRLGVVNSHLDPKSTVAMLLGGITLAIQFAIQSDDRPSKEILLKQIWLFCENALRG